MENVEIVKTILVINGQYSQNSSEYDVEEFNKIKRKLSNPSFITRIFNDQLSKKGIDVETEKLITICPDCANMLKCPKVMDANKKVLKAYPWITYGAEMLFINKFARLECRSALREYQRRLDDGDETVINDEDLLKRLNNTGVEVPSICVFECSKFVDDKEVARQKQKEDRALKKATKKFTDDKDNLDGLVENMKSKGSIKIPDIIKYFNSNL